MSLHAQDTHQTLEETPHSEANRRSPRGDQVLGREERGRSRPGDCQGCWAAGGQRGLGGGGAVQALEEEGLLGGEEEGSLGAQTPLAEVPEVPLILVLREIPGAPGLDPCPQGPPLTSGALSTFSAKPSSLWGIVHLQGTLHPSRPPPPREVP